VTKIQRACSNLKKLSDDLEMLVTIKANKTADFVFGALGKNSAGIGKTLKP